MARGRNLKGLEAALGYKFNSRPMLQRALTHASKRTEKGKGQDNERLEFLGDRVLALAIAELLTELDAEADEGDLARRFNRLVRKEACARVARDLGLGSALVLSAAEAESGGRDKDTILADACEALLAAIFLEAGFPAARDVVRRVWSPLIDKLPDVATDAKSALQEWAQGQGLALPEYVEVARRGPDHAPRFTAEVRIAGRKPARGEGANKRAAEQAAAAELLSREGVWMPGDPCLKAPTTRPREATRCGFIAILGAPNAGKSTLVNALVGAKVTIVSRKAQTTRVPVRGIAIEGASQLIFIDTPGIFAPNRRLDRAMVDAAWARASEADVVALIVDAAKGDVEGDTLGIVDKLAGTRVSRLLILNKIDRVKKENLLDVAQALNARLPFEATFMISALAGSGVNDLKRHLANLVPAGPWHYPEDEISDAPLRLLAAEITRERIYERLHEELPYATTVETTAWKELRGGAVRIEQTIYVERESQRKIVLGESGRTIKQISMEARREVGDILEKPVHLFLFVKVRGGWQNDPERYREIGLDFPKD